MLHTKSTKNIWELKNGFTPAWVEVGFIRKTLDEFKYFGLLKRLNNLKLKGYKPLDILMWLISFPMIDQVNVNRFVKGPWHEKMVAAKDTFYRLINNEKINWRVILSLFVARFNLLCLDRDSFGIGPRCLIVDDSSLHKTGITMEGISRVFDHVDRKHKLGYKLLTLGYWDGKSFLPIDFSLHREKGKRKAFPYGLKPSQLNDQYCSENNPQSPAAKRIKELDKSKIDMAVEMIEKALKSNLPVDYLLMDSWFTCEVFLKLAAKYEGVHLLGMIKASKAKITYRNKTYSFGTLRNKLGKPKRERSFGLQYHQVDVTLLGHKVRLFFSKKGRNGKWRMIVTTNRKLSFREALKIYQNRWGIEVFFKEAKQLLRLGGCQSKSLNAQIASTTLVMIQYILLTIHHRLEAYETKGQLFDAIKEEYIQVRLNDRLWGLLYEILNKLGELVSALDAEDLFRKLLEEEEFWLKIFNIPPSEITFQKAA